MQHKFQINNAKDVNDTNSKILQSQLVDLAGCIRTINNEAEKVALIQDLCSWILIGRTYAAINRSV